MRHLKKVLARDGQTIVIQNIVVGIKNLRIECLTLTSAQKHSSVERSFQRFFDSKKEGCLLGQTVRNISAPVNVRPLSISNSRYTRCAEQAECEPSLTGIQLQESALYVLPLRQQSTQSKLSREAHSASRELRKRVVLLRHKYNLL